MEQSLYASRQPIATRVTAATDSSRRLTQCPRSPTTADPRMTFDTCHVSDLGIGSDPWTPAAAKTFLAARALIALGLAGLVGPCGCWRHAVITETETSCGSHISSPQPQLVRSSVLNIYISGPSEPGYAPGSVNPTSPTCWNRVTHQLDTPIFPAALPWTPEPCWPSGAQVSRTDQQIAGALLRDAQPITCRAILCRSRSASYIHFVFNYLPRLRTIATTAGMALAP
jgi:hypothetical protein